MKQAVFGILLLLSACGGDRIKEMSQPSIDGPASSGGGNLAVAEFIKLANTVSTVLTEISPLTFKGKTFDSTLFAKVVKETRILFSTEQLYLEGSAVDAINDPEARTITFYLKNWQEGHYAHLRVPLLIHEFLGIIREADPDYQVSGFLSTEVLKKISSSSGEIIINNGIFLNGIYSSSNELLPSFELKRQNKKYFLKANVLWSKSVVGKLELAANVMENTITYGNKRMYSFFGNFSLPCENGQTLRTWATFYITPESPDYSRNLNSMQFGFPNNISLKDCKADANGVGVTPLYPYALEKIM